MLTVQNNRLTMLISLIMLAACVLHPAEAEAGSANPPTVDVRSFGAVGDGIADDSDALQSAIDSVTDVKKSRANCIFFPAGTYRITKTLLITQKHRNLQLKGAGHYIRTGFDKDRPKGVFSGFSRILWDGDNDATVVDMKGAFAIVIDELFIDGQKKAGVILRINSAKGEGANFFQFNRLTLKKGRIGIEVSKELRDFNGGDMTCTDIIIGEMTEACFRTYDDQNVNFLFIRPKFGRSPLGVDFQRGGGAVFLMPGFDFIDTCISTLATGVNNGHINITGIWLENYSYQDINKRQVIIRAGGEAQITMTSLSTMAHHLGGKTPDLDTPNFIISGQAHLRVEGANISGRVAIISNTTGGAPAWITFQDCRFKVESNPMKTIQCDGNAGYEINNCSVQDGTNVQFIRSYAKDVQ